MRILRSLVLLAALFVPLLAFGQGQTTGGPTPGLAQPDCVFTFSFTVAGTSANFDNRIPMCSSWHVMYYSDGCSVVSFQPQFAPDNSGAAGSFSIWPATQVFGTLPLNSTSESQVTFSGFHPWINVKLTTATGCTLVQGRVIGWKAQGSSESTAAATPSQGVAGEGTAASGFPQQIGGKFETTPVVLTNGQQGVLQQDANQNLLVKTGLPISIEVTGTTATVIKATAGTVHAVTINTGAAGTFKIFDLASASCTGTPASNQKASITVTASTLQTLTYDMNTSNGICVQASVAMDVTVTAQ